MLPEFPISYPNFVADQLLTAKNLNDLFQYLDKQQRGTRTNLIGIGIVCGLELIIDTNKPSISITKGCGITSEGYLVRWDDAKFENYIPYDAAKELVYSPFYGDGKQRFDIDELKSNASGEGIKKLSTAYLKDKVVLLFVELIDLEAKNCDPESCDDKGENITLTIRPLIVDKKAAAYLNGGLTGGSSFSTTWAGLPEIKMPRHHLPAADINDAGDVFAGFQKVLSSSFIKQLQAQLSQAYSRIFPLVQDIYPSNPFGSVTKDYAFINDGSLTSQQLLYMQYYYDLFSDIIYAYEELRISGMELLSLCCPDENAFPRHLLLGAASNTTANIKSDFRQYFIPSPAVCCHGTKVTKLRALLKRLVLLLAKFEVQNARSFSSSFVDLKNVAGIRKSGNNVPIRITPSKYGDIPLSKKSIPFYYDAATGVDKLFEYWNFELSRAGAATQNLSYSSTAWADKSSVVVNALDYDLEPYNFLRIEGHVGHSYVEALASINKIRDTKRLPFDTVALSADIITLREQMATIANSKNNTGLISSIEGDMTTMCHFQDLEALYDTMAQEFLCKLCKEMKYFYQPPVDTSDAAFDQVPKVPLLTKCDGTFRYQKGSQGETFELFWARVGGTDYLSPDQIINTEVKRQALGNFVATNSPVNSLFNALLYYIEKLSEILPTALVSFDVVAFLRRYNDLMTVARAMKDYALSQQAYNANGSTNSGTIEEAMHVEDILDHLDALLYACRDAQFSALYNDYKTRWVYLAMLQKLGYYAKMHPGIQHKAGVPVGGTFILVYHERSKVKRPGRDIFTKRTQVVAGMAKDARKDFSVLKTSALDLKESKELIEGKKGSAISDAKSKIVADAKASKQPASSEVSGSGDAVKGIPENLESISVGSKQNFTIKDLKSPIIDRVNKLDLKKLSSQLTKKQYGIIDKLFFKTPVVQNDLDELTAELPDKIVIADFFLPYMCCSDCPPVYFIVNETNEPDPVAPTISLTPAQFCSGDRKAYPIAVSPQTTIVSGEGVKVTDGIFTFNPASIDLEDKPDKNIKLTATNDEQIATQNITVFARPTARFEIIPGSSYKLFIFNNLSTNGSNAIWDFGDGVTAKGDNPSHVFEKDSAYVITLTVSNGICTDTVTETINVAQAGISIDGKEFCNADRKTYPIIVLPKGGELKGEGTILKDDVFLFVPSEVAMDAGMSEKKVNISYTFNSQTVGLSLTVFNMPSAEFSVTDVRTAANAKSFSTSNKFGAVYLWDFGDGGTSVESNPIHQFKQAGSYVVKLKVSNGPCVANATQTVSIVQVSMSIKPDSFCSIDQNAYAIAVSPAGGVFSGEGVSTDGTFRPNSVKFDTKQGKKDILLGYEVGSQSAQVNVTVFQNPDGKFTVQTSTTSPATRIFIPNSAIAGLANWDFGDGVKSTELSPTHTYKTGGDYLVSLKLTNGLCVASTEQQVNIKIDRPPTAKDCGTLNNFISAYGKLQGLNPAQYKNFREKFKAIKDVDAFFDKLGQFTAVNPTKQLDFFAEFDIAGALTIWLKSLNDLILDSDVQLIALTLFELLTQLAIYIECIQDFDVTDDKNRVMLNLVFQQIKASAEGWKNAVLKMDKELLLALQRLQQAVSAAMDQLNKTGEYITKKNYMSLLAIINKTLTSYLKF